MAGLHTKVSIPLKIDFRLYGGRFFDGFLKIRIRKLSEIGGLYTVEIRLSNETLSFTNEISERILI